MEIITLMNVCHSWVLTPPKSPFFFQIFCTFDEKLVENLIFWMTYFISFICSSINNHGRLIIFWHSSPTLELITLCNAWLDSAMSLQFFPILSLSVLPSKILHIIYVTFFLIRIVSNKWAICRFSYWENLLNCMV